MAMRTNLELQGLALGLMATKGRAPSWLGDQLDARATPGLDFGAKELRSLLSLALSTASLFAAFIVAATFDVAPRAAQFKPAAVPAVAHDPELRDAIYLAQTWKIAGDELPVLERLDGGVRVPGARRAWSAERQSRDAFLVVFREDGGPVYAFEVDLETEAVRATPEAVDQLTLLRVRDERAASFGVLAAR